MGILSGFFVKKEKPGEETMEGLRREGEVGERKQKVRKVASGMGSLFGDVVKATTPKARKGKKKRRSKGRVVGAITGNDIFVLNGMGLTGELPPMRQPQQRKARQPIRSEAHTDLLNVEGGILQPLSFGNGSNGKRKRKGQKDIDITNLNTPGYS